MSQALPILWYFEDRNASEDSSVSVISLEHSLAHITFICDVHCLVRQFTLA
jgi:hypothetical protein